MSTRKNMMFIFILIATLIPVADVHAAALEDTVAQLQRAAKTAPLPQGVQDQLVSTLKTTCGFGNLDLLSLKNNVTTDFSAWPSGIKTKLTTCADTNPEVLSSIQASIASLPGTTSTNTAPQTATPAPVTVPSGTQTTVQSGAPGTFVPIAPIEGLTKGAVADSQGLATFLRNLYRFLVGIAATLAVIEIVIGGLQYATQDIPSQKSNGKEKIWNALLGLVMVLSPVLIFSLINPAILNFSLQIPPLDTKAVIRPRPAPTTNATLSETDRTLREQDGRKVLFTFEITPSVLLSTSPKQRVEILDAKQRECTQASGGLGIILANRVMGGGANQYVCQTCSSGTKPVLFAKANVELGAGACQ